MSRTATIANERIAYLYALAERTIHEEPDRSRRTIQMLRKLATKHTIRITDKKKTFCTACNTLYKPGTTCTVRIHHERRIITCAHCGTVRRLGL